MNFYKEEGGDIGGEKEDGTWFLLGIAGTRLRPVLFAEGPIRETPTLLRRDISARATMKTLFRRTMQKGGAEEKKRKGMPK